MSQREWMRSLVLLTPIGGLGIMVLLYSSGVGLPANNEDSPETAYRSRYKAACQSTDKNPDRPTRKNNPSSWRNSRRSWIQGMLSHRIRKRSSRV